MSTRKKFSLFFFSEFAAISGKKKKAFSANTIQKYSVLFNNEHINKKMTVQFSKEAFTQRIMSSQQPSNPDSHFHGIFITVTYLEIYIVSSHSIFSTLKWLISIYIAT